MKPILIMGGAHIDRNGTMNKPYITGSSIPGTMREDIGGGAFNVASNLAQLDIPVIFSSPRADGNLTFAIKNKLRNLSNFIDFPIQLEGNSPSYTALKDKNGELIAALADMQLYDELTTESFLTEKLRTKITQADIIITDANFPAHISSAIGKLKTEQCRWYAVATSPAKVKRLQPSLPSLNLLSMNINEAIELTGLTKHSIPELIEQLHNMGLKSGIITDGSNGLHYFSNHTQTISLPPYPSDKIQDVTGAGDAILSGFIASTLKNATAEEALRTGLAAAKITIEVNGACSEQLSTKTIEAIMQPD